jgi:hypothetical protein
MAAVPLFCRHNRFEANCPICSREKAATRRPAGTGGARSGSRGPSATTPARRHGSGQRSGRLVTKRLARATDDGYRNDLIPGVKATEDAERLAASLAVATERLEYPGPYPEVAELADEREDAIWLAFLLALAGPDRPELQAQLLAGRPEWSEAEGKTGLGLGSGAQRTIAAYRAFAERAGSQEAALTGERAWTPARRFGRTFDRLAFPGFGRAARYEFLATLGAARILEMEPDALHANVAHDDPTTLAAKRALNSGDALLLERRAAALAEATRVPIGALDRALAIWDSTAPLEAPEHDEIRAALRLA